jgi:muconolactone delta-isomerase
MELDVETYATVMAELVHAGEARAEVLARRGLSEDQWDVIDSHWQERLFNADDDDESGVSPLLTAYARAYESAQKTLGPTISLEEFAEATRLLQATGDLRASLHRVGITFGDYIRGNEHWSRKIVLDKDLEGRFMAILGRR